MYNVHLFNAQKHLIRFVYTLRRELILSRLYKIYNFQDQLALLLEQD